MVIKVTYKDGTTKQITEGFTVIDGDVLKNEQTTVTIEYEGKTVTQAITVNSNPITKLEIASKAVKLKYIVGQNFDPTGMVVKATYENGTVKEITDYTITDGKNLKEEQTAVTIEYEGKTVTQAITVEIKTITSISIKSMPTKTEYIQNKETLDLTGGSIEISYNDGTKEEMVMTTEEIKATGFDNTKIGKQSITLTYQGYTVAFDIEIKEEAKPENSNFDNVKADVTGIQAHVSTNNNDEDYMIITVALSGITKATQNDKIEYYYYLSSSPNEENISEWIQISDLKNESDKMIFDINTVKLSNTQELANADKLYLYIKEVATRNNMKSELITKSVLLNINLDEVSGEGFVDGQKQVEVEAGKIEGSASNNVKSGIEDDTIAGGSIPKAGKSLFIIIALVMIFILGRISYLRYKDIQVK